jgi:hypothetical protein
VLSHAENFGSRTNNKFEGFHSKLNRLVINSHPKFFKILSIIKEIHNENEIDLNVYLLTGKQKKPIKRYVDCHNKLIDLRERLNNNTIILFQFMEECIGAVKYMNILNLIFKNIIYIK